MSHKNIKTISNPKLKLEILTQEDVRKIHDATLHIIEKVGVRFPSKRALEIWEAHGADVDHEKRIVRVKPQVIDEALKKCPPRYTLAARDPQQDLPLDGNHVCLGTDGCGVEVIDIETREKRTSCLQDVRDIARVADATEEVAFHWVPVSAQDTPAETRGLHEVKAVWENSTKHAQTESIYSVHEANAAMEMAIILAGGKEELRKRPVLSLMQCTAPPLGHDGGSLDRGLDRRRTRHPDRLHDHGILPDDRTRYHGWHPCCRQCGSNRCYRPFTTGQARRARLLRRRANSLRSALRRIHWRRTGRLPLWRGDQRVVGFLQHPAFDGIIRHRREGTELASRTRRRAVHVHGERRHVRHAAGSRIPARQPHLVLCRDDDGLRDIFHHPQDDAGNCR
ncbi:MAG: hypothetical protein HND47_19495 [Chloroflexi bacterium]|nr:hypothetical protein [Chloroflexota bacterium]